MAPVSSQPLIDYLPAIYRHFLPDWFTREVPVERHATCADCAMCETAENAGRGDSVSFDPNVKCCTYYPGLPNYLVGAVLSDDTPAAEDGRRRLRALIAEGIGVTPHGVMAPPRLRLLYQRSGNAFGRAQGLLCPYYDSGAGNCTIWAYREGVCTTWFCKHNAGADGLQFWTAAKDYLCTVQRRLSEYAMHTLGWGVDAVLRPEASAEEALSAREIDGQPPDESDYSAMWSQWENREEEFYRRTFETVAALTCEEFERVGGLEQTLRLQRLDERLDRVMEPRLPDPLRRNPRVNVFRTSDNQFLLQGYRSYDPIRLTRRVYELLDCFDGVSTTRQVLDRLKREHGVSLSNDLLIRLAQHRILVD